MSTAIGTRPSTASMWGRAWACQRDDLCWTRALAWLLLGLAVVEAVVSTVMLANGHDRWGFSLVGGLCTALVSLPFLLTRLSGLSLWGPIALIVTIGTGIRGLAMASGYPNPDVVQRKFILGHSFDDLVGPSVVTVLSMAAVVAGYVLAMRSRRAPVGITGRLPLLRRQPSDRTVLLAVAGFALVGAFGTAMYLKAVGGFSTRVGGRRTIYVEGGGFQSYGHWQFLSGCGAVALVVFLSWALIRRTRLRLLDVVVLALLIANTFALNVITTSRSDVLYVTLGLLMVVSLVRGRVSLITSVSSALLVLVVIGMLSNLRVQGREDPEVPVSEGSSSVTPPGGPEQQVVAGASSGVLNRNGYDLSKTLLIIDAVPEKLPYAHGRTVAKYVFAPIPRALWPQKPAISDGVTIGREVYGLKRTGVPPGLTAELVWNVGRPLAVVLSLVVGLVLGAIDRMARNWSRTNLFALAVQALIILPLGTKALGGSIGQAFSSSGQTLVLLLPLFLLTHRWPRLTSVGPE